MEINERIELLEKIGEGIAYFKFSDLELKFLEPLRKEIHGELILAYNASDAPLSKDKGASEEPKFFGGKSHIKQDKRD